MEQKKTRTIDILKQSRKIPDAAKERLKTFNRIKKAIKEALKDGPKTVPQVAEKTGLSLQETNWYLMTLRKYGEIVTGELDDMDEYFTYKLAKKS